MSLTPAQHEQGEALNEVLADLPADPSTWTRDEQRWHDAVAADPHHALTGLHPVNPTGVAA